MSLHITVPSHCLRRLSAGAEELSAVALAESEKISVYVIPITDAISQPNLFVLRRGLKEAVATM